MANTTPATLTDEMPMEAFLLQITNSLSMKGDTIKGTMSHSYASKAWVAQPLFVRLSASYGGA